MASFFCKLFKRSDCNQSGHRTDGLRRKSNNNISKTGSADSSTHNHNHSVPMHLFGRCPSPKMPKRYSNKISPEVDANSQKMSSTNSACEVSNESDSLKCGAADKPCKCSTAFPNPRVRIKLPKPSKAPIAEGPPLKHNQTVRTQRLMKEYQQLTKYSRSLEKPPFVVELVDDNLYEWNVKLFQIDPESELYHDMQEADIGHILINMVFPENFPFSPPFMRVISPHVKKGFVMEGGAICMELLTPRGWVSAYTIEAMITQFAANLVKGQGRIVRECNNGQEFNQKSAEASFQRLVKHHEKYGWRNPPLADG